MLVNAVIVSLIVAMVAWIAWDYIKPMIQRRRESAPVDPDTQSERLNAIQCAEHFREYAKASGHMQAHSLVGQAIASLYSPESADEG